MQYIIIYLANAPNLGDFYPEKLDDALEMSKVHQDAFEKFDATFPEAITEQWARQVEAWDADSTRPNPYVEPNQGTSLAALKLQIAKEEAEEGARGVFRSQDKSIFSFISTALDLEEEQ